MKSLTLFTFCLILFSTNVECKDKSKASAKAPPHHLSLVRDDNIDLNGDKDGKDQTLSQPELDKIFNHPKERSLSLCLPPSCDADQTLNPSSNSGIVNFSEAMLAAKRKQYGMGLSWAANSRLRLSAEYEKDLYEENAGLVSPEVIQARMRLKF